MPEIGTHTPQRKLLASADRARTKGRKRRAIRLYRRALESAPDSPDIHRKLAPLLARRGEATEAWNSFRVAYRALCVSGFDARAAGLLREAVALLPRTREAWEALGELEAALGRPIDARLALWDGSRHFKGRRRLADRRRLLELANRVDPHQTEVVLALARLRGKAGDARGGERLVEQLIVARPMSERAARRTLFALRPNLRSLWRWWRAPRPGRGTRHAEATPA